MRVLVTGGRDYDDAQAVWDRLNAEALSFAASETSDTQFVVVHGKAKGADGHASDWAKTMAAFDQHPSAAVLREIQISEEPHPADWQAPCDETCNYGPRRSDWRGDSYCPAAGPRRNSKMLATGIDRVVAFPGGDGTKDVVTKARRAGVPVTCGPVEHSYVYEDDEYGSLADGGSYEVYRCTACQRTHYSPLPD